MSKLMRLLSVAAFLFLLVFSSCNKYGGTIPHPPGHQDSLCQVVQLRVLSVFGPDRYAITYNSKGDPVSMLVDSVDANVKLGNLDHYYRYDGSGRLSDQVIAGIQSPTANAWHKYVYVAPDLIVDTLLYFDQEDPSSLPSVNAPTPNSVNAYNYILYTYGLDAQGRVVTATSQSRNPSLAPTTLTWTYDAKGNRNLTDATLTYDDKVNPYLTNKVWQFLNLDYSINNPIRKDSSYTNVYNAFGLPTDLQAIVDYDDNLILFGVQNFNPNIQITYACPMLHGPVSY